MTEETQALPADVLTEVIRHANPADGAFLIGGQALNFWAERYSASAPELREYAPFVSKDIDFFGTADAARKLADALGGKVRVPNADDHTPQSAIVGANVLGHDIEIDFLWNVLGPPIDQLTKKKVQIAYPIRNQIEPLTTPMSVMHPLHCLQSRVANVLRLGRRGAGPLKQLEASPIVLREYVNEALGDGSDVGRVRVATSVLDALHHYLATDMLGLRVKSIMKNNPFDVLLRYADDSRLDQRFRQHQLKSMIDDVRQKQDRIAKNLARAALQSSGPSY